MVASARANHSGLLMGACFEKGFIERVLPNRSNLLLVLSREGNDALTVSRGVL